LSELLLRIAFWVPLAVCTWLALTPAPPRAIFHISDLALHLAAFTYLTFFLSMVLTRSRYARTACVMLAYGVAIELLQHLTVTRTAQWKDLGMDLVGIVVGLCGYHYFGAQFSAVSRRIFGG
jgi:VanZ family protein|tara:strand:- start:281 stop:646 length:366 start_codon:yes stop_codon:yes gene_type:complete